MRFFVLKPNFQCILHYSAICETTILIAREDWTYSMFAVSFFGEDCIIIFLCLIILVFTKHISSLSRYYRTNIFVLSGNFKFWTIEEEYVPRVLFPDNNICLPRQWNFHGNSPCGPSYNWRLAELYFPNDFNFGLTTSYLPSHYITVTQFQYILTISGTSITAHSVTCPRFSEGGAVITDLVGATPSYTLPTLSEIHQVIPLPHRHNT